MTVIDLLKQNYKQPKYMLPAIVYFPLLFTGYTVCNLFATEKADVGDSKLETTEYLNSKLPDAHIKGEGIGNKYDSMLEAYGKIKDESAVENVEKQEEQKEGYDSKYSDAELAALEQQSKEQENAAEQLKKMQEQMRETRNRTENNTGGVSVGSSSFARSGGNTPEETATLNELQNALAQARQQANGSVGSVGGGTAGGTNTTSFSGSVGPSTPHGGVSGSVKVEAKTPKNEKAVSEIEEDDKPKEVVKVQKETSEYFNTIGTNEPQRKLIKAIIDEDIKAVDGSRVRLRLLDDIEVGQTTIKKGTYLYATMSDFSSQRVKGTVKSVLINDDLIKINLSLYDTDGLEGLYVPESSFRTTAKDVGSQALNTSPTLNTGTTIESSLVQWGMNAVQQGIQKTSQAISKNIKKNRVKLKYGTFVYLVNSKEKKNSSQGRQTPDVNTQIQNPFQNIYQNSNK